MDTFLYNKSVFQRNLLASLSKNLVELLLALHYKIEILPENNVKETSE